MGNRVVACHQPNFLPWLGYFAKMARADVFVLLDDVQFTQGHNRHNWTTRVRILTANGHSWLTVPVRRSGAGKQLVSDLRIEPGDRRWLRKMLKTIEAAYGKCSHFGAVYPPIRSVLEANDGQLCELNVRLIDHIAMLLGITAERVRASRFDVSVRATTRLVELTKLVNGTTYLSGDGADDYQDRVEFEATGISLRRVGFRHPVYRQQHAREFVPGLSILDALCNVGIDGTRTLLET